MTRTTAVRKTLTATNIVRGPVSNQRLKVVLVAVLEAKSQSIATEQKTDSHQTFRRSILAGSTPRCQQSELIAKSSTLSSVMSPQTPCLYGSQSPQTPEAVSICELWQPEPFAAQSVVHQLPVHRMPVIFPVLLASRNTYRMTSEVTCGIEFERGSLHNSARGHPPIQRCNPEAF